MSLEYFQESTSTVYVQGAKQSKFFLYSSRDQIIPSDFNTQVRLRIPIGYSGLIIGTKYIFFQFIDSNHRGNIKLSLNAFNSKEYEKI